MTSVFPPMPTIPSIRQTPTASWPTVDINGTISVQSPQLNKIYFNKKTLLETNKRYNASKYLDITEQTWEIPFSVDVEVPVTELTQRIHRVMTDKKIYKHWDINFATFTILAKQETEQSRFEVHA
jgi:hypothetical protein